MSFQSKLALVIFIIILINSSLVIIPGPIKNETNTIEIKVKNLQILWGYCMTEDGGHGDFYAPHRFTLGVLNSGTTQRTLEQINLTEKVCEGNQKTILDKDLELPQNLPPRTYWLGNISCQGGSSTSAVWIDLKVDGTVIPFGEVIWINVIRDPYKNWTSWENYRYYKDIHPQNITYGITLLSGIVIVFLVVQRKAVLKRKK